MKVNAILKEIKSDNITETNQINLWGPSQTKLGPKPNQCGNAAKEPGGKEDYKSQYKSYGNI